MYRLTCDLNVKVSAILVCVFVMLTHTFFFAVAFYSLLWHPVMSGTSSCIGRGIDSEDDSCNVDVSLDKTFTHIDFDPQAE